MALILFHNNHPSARSACINTVYLRDSYAKILLLITIFCSAVEVQDEGMSGVQFFFTLLFSVLGLGVLAVVGLVVYGRWKQNRRKRFY